VRRFSHNRDLFGDSLETEVMGNQHTLRSQKIFKSGRRASRTACDAERRTIVEMIAPHALRGNRTERTQSARNGMRRGASHDS
ncbi:hypothetical protein DXU85_28175, partial [Pseudomonas savastanoi]